MNMINGARMSASILLLSVAGSEAIAADQAAIALSAEKIQVGTGRIQITFNSGRRFFLDQKTRVTERGIPVDPEVLIQVGTGRVGRFFVLGDVNDTFTTGTLDSIEFGSQMKGPVTSTSPLTVLNYPLAVTATTVLDDVPGSDIANLQVGDELELAGFSDANGNFQVTALELEDEPLDSWVITGRVTSVDADRFSMGPQSIEFNGIDPDDCDGSIDVGSFVQVEADPDPTFVFGSTVTTTIDIDCESDSLGGDPGALVPAYVEGFITVVNPGGGFAVGSQQVVVTELTEYEDGDPADVNVGTRVQVEGFLNTDTNILEAAEIEFEQLRVEVRGPLNPDDVSQDGITLLGISMLSTQLTLDEDGLLQGIGAPVQVRVEGYQDADANVYIEEIKDDGTADETDVSVRGSVESVDRPVFTVLGVSVDTTDSVFELDDDESRAIDADTFFALLQTGSEVEIEDATFDSGSILLTGGVISVESESTRGDGKGNNKNAFGVGIGVIIESGDSLFGSGFE